jgi:hypothetical protein
MKKPGHRLVHAGLALLAALACAQLQAADPGSPLKRTEETWMAVSDEALDAQRGGFDIGTGLLVNFGISRAIFINGVLMTETTLNFGQLDKLTGTQAAELGRQLSSLNLVQNGPGNTVEGPLGGVGTVVQNTLNNQRLATHTVINVQTNGMSMLKDLNTANTLTEGIARAIGGR